MLLAMHRWLVTENGVNIRELRLVYSCMEVYWLGMHLRSKMMLAGMY